MCLLSIHVSKHSLRQNLRNYLYDNILLLLAGSIYFFMSSQVEETNEEGLEDPDDGLTDPLMDAVHLFF